MKSTGLKYRLLEPDYYRLKSLLGREPQTLEVVLALALWNEHCSYRSSRKHLKKFAFRTQKKIFGLGEQAGVVDLGQGEKICFKMESHNHPSYIIPYHGSATAVGGILRDIFAMNATPIALADYLCFADTKQEKNPKLKQEHAYRVSEVVRGIGDYGNCIGIPTITGYTEFSEDYKGNILVNAMALGYLDSKSQVMSSKAKGVGNYVVYAGARTGRDGILGADMASQSFNSDQESIKTTVQIGDPFLGKQLMTACLEAMKQSLIVACQDMGAAGLTCSSFEMSDKAGLGLKLHLDRVPLRDKSLQPDEILLSESQERMLFICDPENYKKLKALFEFYGLEICQLGEVLPGKEIQLYWKGEEILKVDPKQFTSHAPLEDRAWEKPEPALRVSPSVPAFAGMTGIAGMTGRNFQKNIKTKLLQYLSSPQGRSRQFIFRQYDQRVGTKTIKDSSYPVAVLRLPESGRQLAMAMGCRPYLMKQDVEQGAKDAVFYPALQLALRGFSPLAVTDCLNFGNPEKKSVMGQFVLSVENIAKACKTLDTPIISGNVSFYNESEGKNIIPTPSIVMAGLKEKACNNPPSVFTKPGESVYLLHSHQFIFEGMQVLYKNSRIKNSDTKAQTKDFVTESTKKNSQKEVATEASKKTLAEEKLAKSQTQKNPYFAYGDLQAPLVKLFIDQMLELSQKNLLSSVHLVGKFGLAYHLSRMTLTHKVGFFLSESFSRSLFQERLYEVIACVSKEKEEALKQELQKLCISYDFIGKTQEGSKGVSFNKDATISLEEINKSYHCSWKDLSL